MICIFHTSNMIVNLNYENAQFSNSKGLLCVSHLLLFTQGWTHLIGPAKRTRKQCLLKIMDIFDHFNKNCNNFTCVQVRKIVFKVKK